MRRQAVETPASGYPGAGHVGWRRAARPAMKSPGSGYPLAGGAPDQSGCLDGKEILRACDFDKASGALDKGAIDLVGLGLCVGQRRLDILNGEAWVSRQQFTSIGILREVLEDQFDGDARALHHRLTNQHSRVAG